MDELMCGALAAHTWIRARPGFLQTKSVPELRLFRQSGHVRSRMVRSVTVDLEVVPDALPRARPAS